MRGEFNNGDRGEAPITVRNGDGDGSEEGFILAPMTQSELERHYVIRSMEHHKVRFFKGVIGAIMDDMYEMKVNTDCKNLFHFSSYLYPGLAELGPLCQLLPGVDVRILGALERLL